MRKLILGALAASVATLAAAPAFAHERDHGRYEERWEHRKSYKKGYRDGYRDGDRDDDWRERREWREEYRGPRAYYPPPSYIPPPRYREERIVYGSWFGDGYTRIVTTYYGRPCWSYSGWRGDWRRPYDIGYALPPGLGYGPPPPGLYRRLPPAPYGYSYVSVDGDLLLIADATRLVVDAILLGGR